MFTQRFSFFVGALLTATLGLSTARPAAAQYYFTSVDVPGASATAVTGLSSKMIAGETTDVDANTHGFLLTKAGFTQIDVPGAWYTTLYALNDHGQFGGVYRDDPAHPLRRHGFIMNKGVLT